MADSSLDEFFAKKDKSKKGKAKSKYTTSDTIAKKLEEGGKRTEPTPKKETKEKVPLSINNQSISIPSTNEQEDDEWKNIEEEERDYSGLRIQALSISEKEKEEEQLKEQMLSEQNGESSKTADGQSGPWKVFQGSAPPVAEVEEEKAPAEPEVKDKEEPKTMTYRPPALRNAPSSTPGGGSSKRYHKNAPQLTSELHFPSLSSAAEGSKGKYSESDKSFQSVKHGVRSKAESQKELQLDLENKFSALHQGE